MLIVSFHKCVELQRVIKRWEAFAMARQKKKKKEHRMTPKELHEQALALYKEGRLAEALAQLRSALKVEESSERWNDWAAVKHALGSAEHAEAGFRRALELDKTNQEAAANLGAFLVAHGRYLEAAPFLVAALKNANEAQRAAIQELISKISASSGAPGPTAVSAAASPRR